MKRLVLVLLILALCGLAIVVWRGPSPSGDMHRQPLERVISQAVGQTTQIQKLSLSLTPPALHLEGVVVGTQPLAQIGSADVRLLPFASLEERRPVLTLNVDSLTLDMTRRA